MSNARAATERLHERLSQIWGSPPGLGRWSAVNHTPIGRRYVVTAFVMFLIGGVLAMLMRAQLAWSDLEWLRVRRKYIDADRPLGAHLLALYWHFMVAVGVVTFAVLHLSNYLT